jgi:hypothetical protein
MQPVPDCRQHPTDEVAEDRGDDYQYNRKRRFELGNCVWRLDKVQTENPIHQPLSYANSHEQRPHEMPNPQEGTKDKPEFVSIDHLTLKSSRDADGQSGDLTANPESIRAQTNPLHARLALAEPSQFHEDVHQSRLDNKTLASQLTWCLQVENVHMT